MMNASVTTRPSNPIVVRRWSSKTGDIPAAVPRIVLGTRHHAVLLAALDPRRRVATDGSGIGPERARLHNRIPGLDVEIAHRRKDPGEPDGPRLRAGDLPARIRRIEIVEIAEGRGRRQLGETAHLLAGAALEVGADEEWPLREVVQRRGKRRDGGARTAKQNESADSGGERLLDLRTFGSEGATPPAQRRTDEARPGNHAGVMCPRIRGPRAPVAAGRLPAFPSRAWWPRKANATASFASPSKKS